MRRLAYTTMLARGALVFALAPAACSLGNDLQSPGWARVVLSAPSPMRLELLTTQRFLVTEGSVQVMDADTDTVSVPFEEHYTLGAPARFYVRIGNITEQSVSFRVRVYLEERIWMDEDKTVAPGDKVEFVYRYDMPTPNG